MNRTRNRPLATLTLSGKVVYAMACLVFVSLYPNGIAADNVRQKKIGLVERILIRALIAMTRRTQDWFGIKPCRVTIRSIHCDLLEPSTEIAVSPS
jgi:hypothetical protein